MNKKIQKVITVCSTKTKDCFDIIFRSAADNQLRFARNGSGRFRSYIQLKKYQKHLRILAVEIFLAAFFLFIGILVGPAFFSQDETHEIYIPDGKGDIMIGNVSKNQATIVFKTLDAAHGNSPLATMARVTVYRDLARQKLVREFESAEYAVTHVIPIDGLENETVYYLAISASENKELSDAKEISTWGDKNPITIYATGETASSCADKIKEIQAKNTELKNSETKSAIDDSYLEEIYQTVATGTTAADRSAKDGSFKILNVQNENYIYGKDKIQVIISWDTNMPATSKLSYNYEDNGIQKYQGIEISKEKTTKHVAVLTTLKTGTKYYFKAMSTNEQGEDAVSEEYSLKTPNAKATISDIIANNFKEIAHSVGL